MNEGSYSRLKKKEWLTRVILWLFFLALSFLYMLPITKHGELALKFLNDGPFHLSRMMSLENIMQAPMNFNYFNHTGVPVNAFYPWLFLYPMYGLYQLTHQLVWSYHVYFILLTWVTLLIAYYCMKKISQSPKLSLVFSVVYVFGTYRLSDIYYRHSVGEAIAYTFLPIVLLGIYQLFYVDEKKWWILAIGMTLLAYSHMLSLFMAVLLLCGFMFLRLFQRQLKLKQVGSVVKAGILSGLLSLGSLGPVLIYSRGTDLHLPNEHILQYAVTDITQLVADSLNNMIGPKLSSTLGLVIVVSLIFCLLKWKQIHGFWKDSLILAVTFTIMSTTLFPWRIFQNTFMKQLQFPWRLLMLATLLVAVSLVAVLKKYPLKARTLVLALAIILGLQVSIITHFAGGQLNSMENPNFRKAQSMYKYNSRQLLDLATGNFDRLVGQWDYSPINAPKNKTIFSEHQVLVENKAQKPKYHYTANEIQFSVKADKGDEMIIPVYRYLGESVYVNNQEMQSLYSKTGGTRVTALKDGVNEVKITYHYPGSVVLCYASSFIVLVVTLLYWGWKQLRQRKKEDNAGDTQPKMPLKS